MKILFVFQDANKPLIFAATQKRLLLEKVSEFPADIVWRLHDGDGWCDGSPDSWKMVTYLPWPLKAEILLG